MDRVHGGLKVFGWDFAWVHDLSHGTQIVSVRFVGLVNEGDAGCCFVQSDAIHCFRILERPVLTEGGFGFSPKNTAFRGNIGFLDVGFSGRGRSLFGENHRDGFFCWGRFETLVLHVAKFGFPSIVVPVIQFGRMVVLETILVSNRVHREFKVLGWDFVRMHDLSHGAQFVRVHFGSSVGESGIGFFFGYFDAIHHFHIIERPILIGGDSGVFPIFVDFHGNNGFFDAGFHSDGRCLCDDGRCFGFDGFGRFGRRFGFGKLGTGRVGKSLGRRGFYV